LRCIKLRPHRTRCLDLAQCQRVRRFLQWHEDPDQPQGRNTMKTDAQLQNDVEAELAWDPAVTHTNVGVLVKDGVVTLTGHPASHAEKYAIEQAAQRVTGVRAIAVELQVNLSPGDERTDGDIAAAAERALSWSALVPARKVRIMVENGCVTLGGEVEWEYQRRAAEAAVGSLLGVKSVANQLVVKPQLRAGDIAANIERALERQARREAQRIEISVDGSYVTLRGKVHSWAERQAAQGVAWSAPGVANVTNELTVVP
jgi:osmotically-inducible protein OsmY